VSPNGQYVATSGHDKTLRLWEKTHEPLVLEDERETEREQAEESNLATGDRPHANDKDKEAGLPSMKTAESERSAERLMEAIQSYKQHREEVVASKTEALASGKVFQSPALPIIMSMYPDVSTAEEFMTISLTKIKSSELEETLLVLPLDYVISLIEIIEILLKNNVKSEIVLRTFFFLVEIHFGPLSSSKAMKALIKSTRDLVVQQVEDLKKIVGFNMAALRHIQHQQDEDEKVKALLEATNKYKDKKRRKKQKQRAIQTAIIAL
jgi:U3 small nucleolar RNA-associated protein 12